MRKDTDKDMTHTSNHIRSLNKRICHSAACTYIMCVCVRARVGTTQWNLLKTGADSSHGYTTLTCPVLVGLLSQPSPNTQLGLFIIFSSNHGLCIGSQQAYFPFLYLDFFVASYSVSIKDLFFFSPLPSMFLSVPFPVILFLSLLLPLSPLVLMKTLKSQMAGKKERHGREITASILRENADERTSNYPYELIPDIQFPSSVDTLLRDRCQTRITASHLYASSQRLSCDFHSSQSRLIFMQSLMKSFGNNQTKLKIRTLRTDGVVQNALNMGVAAKNLHN